MVGIPYMKKAFISKDFCNNKNNQPLEEYIDFLVTNSGEKISVMKFNRTPLRIKWFQHVYKNGLNIYIVRNPRDNWQSKVSHASRESSYFLTMDLLTVSQNKDMGCFNKLEQKLPLYAYTDDDFKKEIMFYGNILDAYSYHEMYYIFYYLWLTALIENIIHADLVININLLSTDERYRKDIEKTLNDLGIMELRFNDARIKEYDEYAIPFKRLKTIEGEIETLVFQDITKKDLHLFYQKMHPMNIKCFGLPSIDEVNQILQNRNMKKQKAPEVTNSDEIIKTLFHKLYIANQKIETLSAEYTKCIQQVEGLEEQGKAMEKQGKALEEHIKAITNSRSYKISKIILSPFRVFKRN
jgi:hypothetical protein